MTLEELLNKLVEKGWRPFGKEYERYVHWCLIYKYKEKPGVFSIWQYPTTYRELCAKESWLWQFCVDNEMIKIKYRDRRYYNEDTHLDKVCFDDGYYYRIIEASLKDESELKDFLVNNIEIWK